MLGSSAGEWRFPFPVGMDNRGTCFSDCCTKRTSGSVHCEYYSKHPAIGSSESAHVVLYSFQSMQLLALHLEA